MQAHRDVYAARRTLASQMSWPAGRIHKVSRPIKTVAFCPLNDTLWVTYCKPKVAAYDKLSGPLHVSALLQGHAGIIADLQFSQKGDILATAGKNDGTILLWKYHERSHSISNSDHGEYNKDDAAIARSDPNRVLLPKLECIGKLSVYQHDLRHMVWSPDGKYIATWSYSGMLRLADARDGGLYSLRWKTRLEVTGCHEIVAFGPNHLALARNNEQLLLWNWEADAISHLPSGDLHGSYSGNYITGLAYSPNGRTLVVGCHVATLQLWTVMPQSERNGELSQEEEEEGTEPHERIVGYDYCLDEQIHLGSGWSAVTLLTFTYDGRFLACTNGGSQIRLVDLGAARVLTTLEGGHTARIESLSFTSDGNTLASGSCDRTIRLWNTETLCGSKACVI